MHKLYYILVSLGVGLLLAAALVWCGLALQNNEANNRAQALLQLAQQPAAPASPSEETQLPANTEEAETGAVLSRDELYGVLQIPSLNLALPVLNQYGVALLETAPCLYPGPEGNTDSRPVVAGHNYASHFKAIAGLQAGDAVQLALMNGTTQLYRVSGVEEISETDVDGLYAGSWDLTLFTCTFLGNKRILVRCAVAE